MSKAEEVIFAAVNEWIAIKEAQNKILALTAISKENVLELTEKAKKQAKREKVPTSIILNRAVNMLMQGGGK